MSHQCHILSGLTAVYLVVLGGLAGDAYVFHALALYTLAVFILSPYYAVCLLCTVTVYLLTVHTVVRFQSNLIISAYSVSRMISESLCTLRDWDAHHCLIHC